MMPAGTQPTILVVEDDPHGLSFLESSLKTVGYRVLSAKSAEEARKLCLREKPSSLVAVISDYRLPGENGIDLVKWVREQDATLSTLIITGQGEKAIVEDSLAAGVFRYLEKPVTHQKLKQVIQEAADNTARLRQSETDRHGLEELHRFDQRVSGVVPREFADHIRLAYRPLHEVGGDFFISHVYSEEKWVLLIGDVSGHTIRSGYVSTYFQGMFRGCVENGSYVMDFLDLFNRTLRQRINSQLGEEDSISLALAAFHFDFSTARIYHWNFGLTPCYMLRENGRLERCPFGKFPLGWVETIDNEPFEIAAAGIAAFYVFTDGLQEISEESGINLFALIYRLLNVQNSIYSLPVPTKDDIFVISYVINPSRSSMTQFEPLISEHYAGKEVDHIDQIISNLRRSIVFALDDRLGDRLYDLLICIREGMLNALTHGCEKAADKFAHLQISMSPDKASLRVVIDDPGRGHQFNLKDRLDEISSGGGKHLGLGIIQHLSDDFHVENKGTSLVFDFEISPVPSYKS